MRLERPQIKRLAAIALGKNRVVQPERENHFERDRSQRGKRSNRDAAPEYCPRRDSRSVTRAAITSRADSYDIGPTLSSDSPIASIASRKLSLTCSSIAPSGRMYAFTNSPSISDHSRRRQVRIANRDRVGDQRPRHADESRGRLEFILRDFAGNVAGSRCVQPHKMRDCRRAGLSSWCPARGV